MGRINAPTLTPELWAKIFANVEQRSDRIDPCEAFLQKRNQAEVHQLKLVCKQFRSVFKTHSELVQRLYLDWHFSVSLAPTLLAGLHQNKGSIRVFWSKCTSPLVDMVMAVLLSAPNISIVDMLDVSAGTISLVGTFKRLKTCSLRHDSEAHLGLAPLAALPRLQQLVLQGQFSELRHLTGLTKLECVSSRVWGAQNLSPALQHLELTDSVLFDVHAQTLPTCTALAHLVLSDAALIGDHINAYVYLDRNLAVVPTNISQLTQLRTLHLGIDMEQRVQPVELKWVSELTSLQELSMRFDQSNSNVFQHISLLTKLTYLAISGFGTDAVGEVHVLHVDFEWHRLQALQKLVLGMKRLHLSDNISVLLQLPELQEVSFVNSTFHGLDDTSCFAALVYQFARSRPLVQLRFRDMLLCCEFKD